MSTENVKKGVGSERTVIRVAGTRNRRLNLRALVPLVEGGDAQEVRAAARRRSQHFGKVRSAAPVLEPIESTKTHIQDLTLVLRAFQGRMRVSS